MKKRSSTAVPTAHSSPTAAPPTPMPSVRRTDTALHPKAPLEVLVSRALDEELEWFFADGEAALRRDAVAILPSYAAGAVVAYANARAQVSPALEVA